ncbi:FUSC family protein, partial [Yangia mangrovi]|nr:FUSC family protein [Alloyangia mangrovi]
ERAAALPGLAETLRPLAHALARWRAPENRSVPGTEDMLPVVLHRDWIGAREAAIRASGALLLFGALWQVTGFAAGAFLLLGMSIMISIFTTFENPIAMLPSVFFGQLLGAGMALVIRCLIWPHAGADWHLVAMVLPFIFAGALLAGHDRGMKVSFDFNMVMLLLLHPALPLTGDFGTSALMALAVVAAPLTALVAYRTVYPPTLRRKQVTLARMMLHDVAALAGDADALRHRAVWRARLYHRMLRLFRLTERSARAQRHALDSGLALLDLGHATMRAHEILASPDTPPHRAPRAESGAGPARTHPRNPRPCRRGAQPPCPPRRRGGCRDFPPRGTQRRLSGRLICLRRAAASGARGPSSRAPAGSARRDRDRAGQAPGSRGSPRSTGARRG